MKHLIFVIVFSLIYIHVAIDSHAAEFTWVIQLDADIRAKRIPLPDEDYYFKLDTIPCGVDKPRVHKLKRGGVLEVRTMYCWVQKDMRVATTVQCSTESLITPSSRLEIKYKGVFYGPMLDCYSKVTDESEDKVDIQTSFVDGDIYIFTVKR